MKTPSGVHIPVFENRIFPRYYIMTPDYKLHHVLPNGELIGVEHVEKRNVAPRLAEIMCMRGVRERKHFMLLRSCMRAFIRNLYPASFARLSLGEKASYPKCEFAGGVRTVFPNSDRIGKQAESLDEIVKVIQKPLQQTQKDNDSQDKAPPTPAQ